MFQEADFMKEGDVVKMVLVYFVENIFVVGIIERRNCLGFGYWWSNWTNLTPLHGVDMYSK